MAGNIIPAIATTNAVIAGLIVLEGLKILSGKIDQCRTVSRNMILLLSYYSLFIQVIFYLLLLVCSLTITRCYFSTF